MIDALIYARDVFLTAYTFEQVVECDTGTWVRPIPGYVPKLAGTPLRGYYRRVWEFRTLGRRVRAVQIIPRPELVRLWHDGDPNVSDLEFYLWRGTLPDAADEWTYEGEMNLPPAPTCLSRGWRYVPVRDIFTASMEYMSRVVGSSGTYRISLPVKWDIKCAMYYAKEWVKDGCTTQEKYLQRDGKTWLNLPCGAWRDVIDEQGKGVDWSWESYHREEITPAREGILQRRYIIFHGPVTLTYDTQTHIEWQGEFPTQYVVQFKKLFTSYAY